MSQQALSDSEIRLKALDPTQSFIVQAPAGSGKTELLTQRYLKLLATVQNGPEEIIAITFTRKAAAEMRGRIIKALQMARDESEPNTPHRQQTWQLARRALMHDQKSQWQILDNPNRLRILTIDALCALLNARLPILSRFGAQPGIAEQASTYYDAAFDSLYQAYLNNPAWAPAFSQVLLHLDNRLDTMGQLCAELLSHREQWLPHIINAAQQDTLRIELEESLARLVSDKITQAYGLFPNECQNELLKLAQTAGRNLQTLEPKNPIASCAMLTDFPGTECETLPQWTALSQLLLTKAGEWRKSVTKRCGFPTSEPLKAGMKSLLEQLSSHEDLRLALNEILICPPTFYNTTQWSVLGALIEILPVLCAHLQVIFQNAGEIDFVELNLAALRALGTPLEPTDLALHLDYQIRHLLVDEFQDTSITQFTLLERLVAGWEPGDGRSLFLVGDPMQSIYRFRQAEVSLFLHAQRYGIGPVTLTYLALIMNFRSQAGIVDWVNQHFENIFPSQADLTFGAIPLATAKAMRNEKSNHTVDAYQLNNREHEATFIVERINNLLDEDPECNIAILVRSRSHLLNIIPELQEANIAFQAVDIDPLQMHAEIQDLLSLTRALTHRGDRLAWFAVLRAPWCGATLKDLLSLAQQAKNNTIYEALCASNQPIFLRIKSVLKEAITRSGQLPLAAWIKGAWIALGGPACLETPQQLKNADQFFMCLSQLPKQKPFELSNLEHLISNRYTQPQEGTTAHVHIMTIHKSKGLEFDHVIIPQLERNAPMDPPQLMLWFERPSEQHTNDLLMAPIKASHEQKDAIYQYLRHIDRQKSNFETARLLYVAITRARDSVTLTSTKEKGGHSSFLTHLTRSDLNFKVLGKDSGEANEEIELSDDNQYLKRLPETWESPFSLAFKDTQEKNNYGGENQINIIEENNTRLDKIIGTVLHEALAHYGQFQQLEAEFIQQHLQSLGFPLPEILAAAKRIHNAILTMREDPRGQWILKDHQDSQFEYPLIANLNGQITKIIIDRTFIDETGIRWIIDYKSHAASDQDCEKHRLQLEKYANIMQLKEPRTTIRLGLYFPLTQQWQELIWANNQNNVSAIQ